MKVAVLGATGNIGTAVIERLAQNEAVEEILGVARRLPDTRAPGVPDTSAGVNWRSADIRTADWASLLAGADTIVHLAWMFRPTRDPDLTWANNVVSLDRLLHALPDTGVKHLVVASSVAAYSPRQTAEPVDESWATHGASSAAYAREKAYLERMLDAAEGTRLTITRIRPAFVFQRRAASEQRRIFAGRAVPQRLIRPATVPVLPVPRGLRLQTVHAHDVADAVVRIVTSGAGGAFNLCADDLLWPEDLAAAFDARPVTPPAGLVRVGLVGAWTARVSPAPPNLFDALLRVPVLSNQRAREVLDWEPAASAAETFRELLSGLSAGAGYPTRPLEPS